MLKMVDGTGIIGLDMVCPLGGAVSPPQPPNYDKVEVEGVGDLMLPNSLKAPLERLELIGNSTQGENPAPDNPQEIKSAGRKSKNLLNLQKQPDVKETYLGWKVSDGRNVVLSVKDKGNNADITGCYLGLSRTGGSSDGVVWVVNNGSVAVKEVVSNNQYVSVFPSNETTVRKLLERFDVQVEYGNNATDYEPYGYFLDVKVTGKNLIPDTVGFEVGSFNYNTGVNASLPDRGRLKEYIPIAPGKKYLVTVNGNTSIDDIGVHFLDINRFPVAGYGSARFISPLNAYYVRIRYKGWTENDKVSLQLQDTSLDYEPYTEQTVQIALDEPLRGIGEYKDMLTKDGVVRKIKRVVLDGSEDEEWRLDRKLENHINFALVIKGAITVNTGIRTMMDKFKYLRAVWNNDLPGQDMFGAKLRINMPKTLATDLKTFKTWLSQNPLTVDYVLAEPVTEPLPESVQQQLQALHSENGTTHVFVDSGEVPCGIKLTYRKEI